MQFVLLEVLAKYSSHEQDLLVLLVEFHNLVLVLLLGKLRSYILGKYLVVVSGFSSLAIKHVSVCHDEYPNEEKRSEEKYKTSIHF